MGAVSLCDKALNLSTMSDVHWNMSSAFTNLRKSLIISEETTNWFALNHGLWKQPCSPDILNLCLGCDKTSPFPRVIGHLQITQVSPKQQWQPQHTEQTRGKQWKLCNPHSLNAHSLSSCSYRSAWNIWVCPWEACPTARKKNILSWTEKPCCWGVEQNFYRWKESALVFPCSAILIYFDGERWLKHRL